MGSSSGFGDLQEFLSALDKDGDLARVSTPVDPQLEEERVGLAHGRPRRDPQQRHDLAAVEVGTQPVELLLGDQALDPMYAMTTSMTTATGADPPVARLASSERQNTTAAQASAAQRVAAQPANTAIYCSPSTM